MANAPTRNRSTRLYKPKRYEGTWTDLDTLLLLDVFLIVQEIQHVIDRYLLGCDENITVIELRDQ